MYKVTIYIRLLYYIVMVANETKTIKISKTNYDILASHAKYGDSMNDVITKILSKEKGSGGTGGTNKSK